MFVTIPGLRFEIIFVSGISFRNRPSMLRSLIILSFTASQSGFSEQLIEDNTKTAAAKIKTVLKQLQECFLFDIKSSSSIFY